jgi:hypothetical protein
VTNLRVDAGIDYAVRWTVTNPDGSAADLTGWSAKGQWRPGSEAKVILHEWSTAIGNLELAGQYATLKVAAGTSADWPADWAGPYDIVLTDPGGGRHLLDRGTVSVVPLVTSW